MEAVGRKQRFHGFGLRKLQWLCSVAVAMAVERHLSRHPNVRRRIEHGSDYCVPEKRLQSE
jgi:hypothetical protein